MDACREFRTRLTEALVQGSDSFELSALSWHGHLAGCGSCRELLAAEEALEDLLASLPVPKLPPELTERVLARLEAMRLESMHDEELRLDTLLGLAGAIEPPTHLADQVLAALSPALQRSDAALDRLLDRVPRPAVPTGLAERVLAGLDAELATPVQSHLQPPVPRRSAPHQPRLLTGSRTRVFLAAAGLALLAGAASWFLRPDVPQLGFAWGDEPPREFLEALPVLENFELLTSDDLDFLLASAAIEQQDEWIEWKGSKR